MNLNLDLVSNTKLRTRLLCSCAGIIDSESNEINLL
jgi:hypothetical protein